MVQWSGKEEMMDTNCLLYMPMSKKLVAGYVDNEGFVYLMMPGHGGGWNVPLILNNSLVPSKILGIHNGYHGGLGTAYAVPLFREEIEDTLNKMNI